MNAEIYQFIKNMQDEIGNGAEGIDGLYASCEDGSRWFVTLVVRIE